MFNTPFNRQKYIPERNSGVKIVETAGYISSQQRIENMILAGQRLTAFRSEQYDFPDEKSVDDNFYDPTRNRGLDLAEATMIQNQVTSRLEQQAKVARDNKLESDKIPQQKPAE